MINEILDLANVLSQTAQLKYDFSIQETDKRRPLNQRQYRKLWR